jgi:hypothetical protein
MIGNDQELKAWVHDGRMTQIIWNALTEQKREELRDNSGLSPQLVGVEGWRVEAIAKDGTKRRFIVGRSTGWRPCSLELARRNSSGGSPADRFYESVRRLYKVR